MLLQSPINAQALELCPPFALVALFALFACSLTLGGTQILFGSTRSMEGPERLKPTLTSNAREPIDQNCLGASALTSVGFSGEFQRRL